MDGNGIFKFLYLRKMNVKYAQGLMQNLIQPQSAKNKNKVFRVFLTVFTLASCKFYPFILQTLILTGPLVIAVTPLLKRLSCINMVDYYYYYYY